MKRYAALLRFSFLTLLVTAFLTSCPSPMDWSEYDGVNLIAARDFGSGEWYFADGLTDGPGGNPDFVDFEAVTSGYAALPTGVTGPVYRYEIVNLLPNGDFEDSDLSDWTIVDSGGGTPPTAMQEITGDLSGTAALSIVFGSSEDRLYTILDSTLIGGIPADTYTSFAFHIDFKMPVSTFGIEINNGIDTDPLAQWEIARGTGDDQNVVYSYPGTGLSEPAFYSQTNVFTVGSDTSQTLFSFGGFNVTAQDRIDGLFDDLRIVRADQGHYLRLPVPYRDNLDASRPELVSGGTYTLSVWVAPDPTAGSNNRIAARLFSWGIDMSVATSTPPGKAVSVDTEGPENLQSLTGWTQFIYEEDGVVQIGSSTDDDDILFDLVFEIGHYIGGSEYCDAGSVLLADPVLTWSPD